MAALPTAAAANLHAICPSIKSSVFERFMTTYIRTARVHRFVITLRPPRSDSHISIDHLALCFDSGKDEMARNQHGHKRGREPFHRSSYSASRISIGHPALRFGVA